MPAEAAPCDLRSFLDLLRRDGELVEVTAEVDPRLNYEQALELALLISRTMAR